MSETRKGKTRRSRKLRGGAGNYGWPVTVIVGDGFVMIEQEKDFGVEVVLLSPGQYSAMLRFVAGE